MIRIRFHGRGGHGVKTASRIVGTAAFLAGYEVQDSPIYGAERRGAPIAAFTRISDSPILERGVIDRPDLIIIADETLLTHAAALAGHETCAAVFVNCLDAAPFRDKIAIETRLVGYDVTGRTLAVLGQASALSAGLGAAAARLTGKISEEQVLEATREELAALHLSQDLVEKNLQLVREVFAAVPAVELQPSEFAPWSESVVPVPADDPVRGAPSIFNAGNSAQVQTGTWRVERPVIDRDMCTRCGLCFVQCPDGAIALDAEGYPVIDYDHCKGCMICRQVCPLVAIQSEKEVRAW
jgi:pyruvate ferredoxin oxidoreductase gamma subunit